MRVSMQVLAAAMALPYVVQAAPQDADGMGMSPFVKRTPANGWAMCHENYKNHFKHFGCYDLSTNPGRVEVKIASGGTDKLKILPHQFWCTCYHNLGGTRVDPKRCNVRCRGSKVLTCGGKGHLASIWKDNTIVDKWDPKDAANGYRDMGCYIDDSARIVKGFVATGNMSIHKCKKLCGDRGTPYALVEHGNQCALRSNAVYAKNQGVCNNNACTGAPNQKCGGAWAGRLFYNPNLNSRSPCSKVPKHNGGWNPAPKPTKKPSPPKPAVKKVTKIQTQIVTHVKTITVGGGEKKGKKMLVTEVETQTKVATVTVTAVAKGGNNNDDDDDDDENDNGKDGDMEGDDDDDTPTKVTKKVTKVKNVVETVTAGSKSGKKKGGNNNNDDDDDDDDDKKKTTKPSTKKNGKGGDDDDDDDKKKTTKPAPKKNGKGGDDDDDDDKKKTTKPAPKKNGKGGDDDDDDKKGGNKKTTKPAPKKNGKDDDEEEEESGTAGGPGGYF
ncbi:hypothetical protein DRE_02091 [Drechslerella stenobrocha 248]|uniref:WSC domain-containing protein n=1 Tax=Drechslerella stenobrocha 248 TaxID=1043628 RepID=W7I8B3_9PEZI|nr:hypothetical protein DRE_02091 [Drechslerella stenobrocha 248]